MTNEKEKKIQSPELIKNKYYRAEEINTLLQECGAVLSQLREENSRLREKNTKLKAENEELSKTKSEVGDAILSSKIVARQIISEANREAERRLRAADEKCAEKKRTAEEQAQKILQSAAEEAAKLHSRAMPEDSVRIQETAIQRAAESFARLKDSQMQVIDSINAEWQKFLLDICAVTETADTAEPEDGETDSDETGEGPEETAPEDLERKINEIASLLCFEDPEETE